MNKKVRIFRISSHALTYAAFFAFWILISTRELHAQKQDAGTQKIFTELGLGARAQGFGQAYVGIANDGSAVFWNPAGLDYLQQANFAAYHSTGIVGTSTNFATLTYPFVSFGTVGVGVAFTGVNGIPITDTDNNSYGDRTYSYQEYYFSYGKKLPWFGLAVGSTFKIIHETSVNQQGPSVFPVSGTTSTFDLGLMYRPDFETAALRNLSVGLNIQNITAPKMKLIDSQDSIPYNIKLGLAKEFYFGGEQLRKLTIAADVNKGQVSKMTYSFGAEFMYNRYLNFRVGMNNGQPAIGIGTEFKQFQRFQVDYAFSTGNAFGTPMHRLSLTVNFGKTVEERIQISKARRMDEDQKLVAKNQEAAKARALKEHQALGKELFRDKKLIPALVEFEQVAQLDPNNETARMYLDSVNVLMDKQLADQLSDTAAAVKNVTIGEENEKFVKEHYRKGYKFVEKGDYIAALSEFQNAYDRAPKNSEIAKALTDTRTLLDKRIGSFIAKARSSAAANNFAEALKLLSEARGLDPTNQTIQKAIDQELKSISTRLSFLESTRNGLDAYSKGNYQEAMEAFEKALLIDPSNETIKEYHKKAIVRAFATFKNLEGDQEKTYLQGVDLYVEGKYEQAIVIWQRILEKDPLNKRVLKAIDKAEEQLRTQKELKKKKGTE